MPASQKKMLRLVMKEKRALLSQNHPDAGETISKLFFDFFNFPPKTVIGGYWPMGSELDIRPLLKTLIAKKFNCALPCITSEGIFFRLWKPSSSLVEGKFKIFEPDPSSPLVIPDVLLVPLLAFDKAGHRLGYGQGHYDKFLHQHKVMTIGIGFKGQEIDKIPHQPHDFALNYILTEEGLVDLINSKKGI